MTDSRSLPDGYPFTRLYQKRVANNQDLAVIISDHQNRRGTGKTVFSLKLARLLDRTDAGITEEKVALNPAELTDAYTQLPKGSALVLDEAEAGLSKYEAASAVNRAMRELVSMGRIKEKYLLLNLPATSELDRDLKALCDFWFMVQRKGRALGHFLRWNPYSEEPRTPKTEFWEWTDIPTDDPLREIYDYLTAEKEAYLHGDRDGSDQYIEASEAHQRIEQAQESASVETRNEMLRELYNETSLTQQQLADASDLSRSRVADIVNS